MAAQEIWLVRHGETAWSRTGQHTGRSDIPLTPRGREQAAALSGFFDGREFALVLSSPLQRAWETCQLTGFGEQAQLDPNLREWDYGDYEGITTAKIRDQREDWNLWADGVPNGETLLQVAPRALDVIDRANQADGDVVLFAHGHLLRIMGALWIGLPPQSGRLLALATASLSVLSYERESRVISQWNIT